MMQGPSRSDIWFPKVLWITSWLLLPFFWIGLTDGRSSETWRALGFAYAAIYLLGNTYVYYAKTPVQTIKLFLVSVVLLLGATTLYTLDGHLGAMLFPAMFFSPAAPVFSAQLNPRYNAYFKPIRAAGMCDSDPAVFDWKTALRTSARNAVPVALLGIINRAIDGRKPPQGFVGWFGLLVFGLVFGFTGWIIFIWSGWKVAKR
jgi:hypothetical protein